MIVRPYRNREELAQIETLYLEAFPASERKPFAIITEKCDSGMVEILYLEQEGAFAGLAITMQDGQYVLLDYFAILKEKRGCGLGGVVLEQLFERYREKQFFLEIEDTREPAENRTQRLRRKRFYLRNGMTELGLRSNVFGVNMELLGHRANLSFEAYRGVYETVYGSEKAARVRLR